LQFNKLGHHSTKFGEPVSILTCDKEIVLNSKKMKEIADANGTIIKPSPPYIKWDYYKTIWVNINIPDISPVLNPNIKQFINHKSNFPIYNSISYVKNKQIYGLQVDNVQELVARVQGFLLVSKKTLILMSEDVTIVNFPVSRFQIEKYYSQNQAYIKSNLRKISVKYLKDNVIDENDNDEKVIDLKHSPHYRMLRENRLSFASQISVDFFPIENMHIAVYVESKEGVSIIHILKLKKHILNSLKSLFLQFNKLGHHSTKFGEPVSILTCDKEIVLNSKKMKEIADAHGTTIKPSPPYIKQLNGNVERFVQTLSDSVAAAQAAAPHMPPALIDAVAVYMNMVNLLKRGSTTKDKSRFFILYKQ